MEYLGVKLQKEFKGKLITKSEILKPAPKYHLYHLNITCTMLISFSSLFSTDGSLHGFIFSNHKKIEEFALVGIQLLRELPSVTIDGTLCQSQSQPPHAVTDGTQQWLRVPS